MKPAALALAVLVLCTTQASQRPEADGASGAAPSLRVSDNRRFLVRADGTPFFYLGDTAWELFHRLNREETEHYLETRRRQGFTVIQAVVLAELDGLRTPNAYGHLPLVDEDPRRLNEDYFAHVDWVVKTAERKGLFVGMLPTWGDKVFLERWGIGPVVFENPEVAREYGRLVGRRYRDAPNIIWINGGDRRGETYEPTWDALAEGLREGDGGTHLITFHPGGGRSSSEWFHARDWLDFNMLQSGHSRRDAPNYELIARDYARTPVKPTLDGEPRYEDHPIDWDPKNGWFDDSDVRQAVYWSLFAGGLGVTYGCHDVWQMFAPGRKPISSARLEWRKALDLPGAWQMRHVRQLLESQPFLERVPDQSLIAGDPGSGADHVRATRGERYAFVYIPTGKPVEIRLGGMVGATPDFARLRSLRASSRSRRSAELDMRVDGHASPGHVRAEWFDPRTGGLTPIGTFPAEGTRRFTPPGKPGRGNDWVLVLDAS